MRSISLLLACSAAAAHPITSSYYISDVSSAVNYGSLVPTANRETLVHMFSWTYASIQSECQFLGKHGFKGIQISPPQENLQKDGNPWWDRYQPKSYSINTRSGDRAALKALTAECDKWGVDIIADAVINHMGGAPEATFASTWDFNSFHQPKCDISNYCDHNQVRVCDLSGLRDLATEKENVRAGLAAYLNDLIDLGVAGFRVDAAKHINPADLSSIFGRLKKNKYNQTPFVVQEVFKGADCEIQQSEYFNTISGARVTENAFAGKLLDKINNGKWTELGSNTDSGLGQNWGLVPTERSVHFVDNHDTQMDGAAPATYKSGDTYWLANAFMLAWPYGVPKVLSGFVFSSRDASPPAVGANIAPHDCNDVNGNLWVCTHRFRPVAAAAQWRAVTSGTRAIDHYWNQGTDRVGFGRAGKGYIVFNGNGAPFTATIQTGLPAGVYCDTATGVPTNSGCEGSVVTVASGGTATFTVGSRYVSIIHTGAQSGSGGSPGYSTCSDSAAKVDCGYNGITAQGCVDKGCCWIPGAAGSTSPWCFYKNSKSSAAMYSLLRGSSDDAVVA